MTPALGAVVRNALVVSDEDSVGVALRDLAAGEMIACEGHSVRLRDRIPAGHKFTLRAHKKGEAAVKYGAPIGRLTEDVEAGAHLHVHNLRTALSGQEDYEFEAPSVGGAVDPTHSAGAAAGCFQGYRRPNGRVGVRNEIWVIATVGCVANVCEQIARRAERSVKGRVDGVFAITHPLGCSQLGEDLLGVRNILAALAGHPNAGGIVLVGLGCESNQIDALLAAAPWIDPERLRIVRAQDEADEIAAGLRAVEELTEHAERDQRTACEVGDLVIGLKCGGSDGFSGLTANPLVGRMATRVTEAGGAAILTEIPEMFGAERLLMRRAADRETFAALVQTVNGFKQYFLDQGQPVYENPSPGNKDGGITTLEEKSLGAVQKAGTAMVTDVLGYGERVRRSGLAILEAPGNDAVSSTALAAAGASLILFTTGRGTPLGFPVPTVKIASNSGLAVRKPQWIDFDAGAILGGEAKAHAEERLLARILEIAGGARTRNEENGERSIAIWKRGVTL